jgi:hypothetical protein
VGASRLIIARTRPHSQESRFPFISARSSSVASLSGSTQKQALSARLFLCRHVPSREIGGWLRHRKRSGITRT